MTADSGPSPKSVTFSRNRRSRCSGILGHVRPERAVTLVRNTHAEHRNLSALTCRTLLLLLYATGLRISEALSLDIADVDLEAGLLRIRESKFYKTRLVPMGPDLLTVVAAYAAQRNKHPPATPDAPFLLTRRGKRPSRAAAEDAFKHLAKSPKSGATTTAAISPGYTTFVTASH